MASHSLTPSLLIHPVRAKSEFKSLQRSRHAEISHLGSLRAQVALRRDKSSCRTKVCRSWSHRISVHCSSQSASSTFGTLGIGAAASRYLYIPQTIRITFESFRRAPSSQYQPPTLTFMYRSHTLHNSSNHSQKSHHAIAQLAGGERRFELLRLAARFPSVYPTSRDPFGTMLDLIVRI